jgi:hypothetical protein
MENLRAQIEADLHESLEGEWGMPVELTNPDGLTQIYSANNPDELLKGQVLYFSRQENPATGEVMIVNQPVVTLRISSLIREPKAGEKWYIKFAKSTVVGAPMLSWVFTPTKAPEHGTDIGFIRIYPQRVAQSEVPVS